MTDEKLIELMTERARLLQEIEAIDARIEEAGRTEDAMDYVLSH